MRDRQHQDAIMFAMIKHAPCSVCYYGLWITYGMDGSDLTAAKRAAYRPALD